MSWWNGHFGVPEPRNSPCCGYFADCRKPWCHFYSKVFQPPEPKLSTFDIRPVMPGCKGSKLGFRVCAGARPRQTGVAEWKTMLRRFAAGLWGALWIGLQVCLAWFPFPAGGFGSVMRRTPANAKTAKGVMVGGFRAGRTSSSRGESGH